MKKFNKITPEGTKDILFEECLSQRTVSERLTHIFKMRGYNEVITPGMEYYDVFDAPNAAIPPVSYTHLDVYKRQPFLSMRCINPRITKVGSSSSVPI